MPNKKQRRSTKPEPNAIASAVADGVRIVTLDDLKHDEHNANKGTERGGEALESSIERLGIGRGVLADKHLRLIGGNKTVEKLRALGVESVIVVPTDGKQLVVTARQDLDLDVDPKARELAYADNRVAELDLAWDLAQLDEDAKAGIPIEAYFEEDEIREFKAAERAANRNWKKDPNAIPEATPTTIRPGDLFQLGDHRVLCGDARKPEDVARLLDGAEPHLLLTDPPYCSGGFQEAGRGSGSIGTSAKIRRRIANDTLSTRGFQALLKNAIGAVDPSLIYIFTDWRMWNTLFDVSESSGYGVRNMIVWDKGSPGMGEGWRTQHELILLGSKATVKWDRHKAVGNVIACARSGNEHHPTEKPVELLEKILFVTDMAENVVDTFAGSGSTLIACEKVGRRCFAMEVDPAHVQTIINRWEAFTDKQAVKL